MTATVVRITSPQGPRFTVRCLDHPSPWNADAGWAREKAERLALEHDARAHPQPGVLFTHQQIETLHDVAASLVCFCGEHYDDPAGEFIHSGPCAKCRLEAVLKAVAA